jgi:hypothetical protein
MFVPLSHRPCHSQADFGEADGYMAARSFGSIIFAILGNDAATMLPRGASSGESGVKSGPD